RPQRRRPGRVPAVLSAATFCLADLSRVLTSSADAGGDLPQTAQNFLADRLWMSGGITQQPQAVEVHLDQLELEPVERLEAADEFAEAVGGLAQLGETEHAAHGHHAVGAGVHALRPHLVAG